MIFSFKIFGGLGNFPYLCSTFKKKWMGAWCQRRQRESVLQPTIYVQLLNFLCSKYEIEKLINIFLEIVWKLEKDLVILHCG